jgi:molecular chaperone GrpE (heat shock protein)
MLSDKLFKFKLETNRAGFFDFFKNALVVINKGIEDNAKALSNFSQAVGEGLVNFIKQALLGGAALLDLLRPIFQAVAIGIGGLLDVVKGLPPGIREMGIVGFLMLGRTGKIAVVGILGLLKAIGVDLDAITNKVFGATKQTEELGPAFRSVNEFIKKIEENIIVSKEQLAELQKELKKVEDTAKKTGVSFEKIKDSIKNQIKKDLESINETIGKFILKGVDNFSRALAEAVVLGKELKMSLEEIAKNLLVEILAFTIKTVIQLGIQKILEGTIFDIFKKQREQCEDILGIKIKDATVESIKLALMKQQTAEMEKQKKIKGTTMLMSGNPLGFLGFMASGGSVGKGQAHVVGERGPELFIPNSSGQITQSARGMGGRSANVTFNINTIDSRGFDQALVENRGTITAIINNALTERGRGELI